MTQVQDTSGIPPKGWIREGDLLQTRAIPFRRSKLRQEVAAGRFPKPKAFSTRVIAYSCEAVHAWIRTHDADAAAAQ